VMLVGAPSTGKSRFAKLIHESSKLKGKPMTTINLAALSPLQIETELFGAPLEKLDDALPFGRGKLARCRGETLYIEHINRLHPEAQLQLLNIISGNSWEVGKLPACRLITSSCTDLSVEIKEGRFRQDLWYALGVYKIQIPCLAERPEDIPLLCESIITRICVNAKLRRPTLTRRALEVLLDHAWPGNLDELHSCLEHAVTRTTDGLIGPDDFPPMHGQTGSDSPAVLPPGISSIDDLTKLTLMAALDACGGNRRRTAKRLKVSLRTIYNMIDRYGLPKKKRKTREAPGEQAIGN
jgi:DNA-binding NtrC family response regulator